METLNWNSPFLLLFGQIILLLLFIFLIIKRDKIFKDPKNEFLKVLHDSIKDVKVSFKNPFSSIFCPILVALIFYFAIRTFIQSYETQINPDFETFLFIFVLTTVIGPIAEEIIQCITLSVVFVGESHIFKKYSIQETNLRIYGILFIVLILDAMYMAYFHNNKDTTIFFIRMSSFVIFGFLYIINERNIVPPIIAHSTWNLLVVMDSLSVLKT
jgi:membrane protease YdiL (CAAX protease family)